MEYGGFLTVSLYAFSDGYGRMFESWIHGSGEVAEERVDGCEGGGVAGFCKRG